MMPELKLSKFASVIVGARISKTGTPQGESGDLRSGCCTCNAARQGKLQTLWNKLLINQVRQ
jgi:hypothetical protein